MNRYTGRQSGRETAVRNTTRPTAWPRWRAAVAGVAVVTGAAVLAGCGQEIPGAVPNRAAIAAAANNLAVAENSSCVQATPVVDSALGVLTGLQGGTVTAAGALQPLATDMTELSRMARAAPDDVVQEDLANAYDAFTGFRAVMQNKNAPAYPDTFDLLTGTLSGFQRDCSVVSLDPAAGPRGAAGTTGWAAANANTVLARSATAHDAHWSLRVANAGLSPAAVGFTDSPSSLSTTLKGSEQVALWARAVTGAPTVSLQVRELSGGTVVGSQQVTMRLNSAFRFEYLTYQVRRPGASRLSVTISAAGLAPGEAFLVDSITIVRS